MEKRRKMAAEMRKIEIQNQLSKAGVDVGKTAVDLDDTRATASLMAKAEEEKASAEEAAIKKKSDQAKRNDYIVRAIRVEERPLLLKQQEDRVKQQAADHEAAVVKLKTDAKAKFEARVEQGRLLRAEQAKSMTFEAACQALIDAKSDEWRNPKHRAQRSERNA